MSTPPRILRRLSAASQEGQPFQPQWIADSNSDVIAQNTPFGQILHGVVCQADGRPCYDLPLWAEPVGAICVPVDRSGSIGLIEQYRPAPVSNDQAAFYPVQTLNSQGRWSLELPRGFAEPGEPPEDTARRETEEELQRQVRRVQRLGPSNTNTTFFLNNHLIFLVEVDQPAQRSADSAEVIRAVRFFSWDEVLRKVASGEIICGMTKSALLTYYAVSNHP